MLPMCRRGSGSWPLYSKLPRSSMVGRTPHAQLHRFLPPSHNWVNRLHYHQVYCVQYRPFVNWNMTIYPILYVVHFFTMLCSHYPRCEPLYVLYEVLPRSLQMNSVTGNVFTRLCTFSAGSKHAHVMAIPGSNMGAIIIKLASEFEKISVVFD